LLTATIRGRRRAGDLDAATFGTGPLPTTAGAALLAREEGIGVIQGRFLAHM
jgi:hypothetical protein